MDEITTFREVQYMLPLLRCAHLVGLIYFPSKPRRSLSKTSRCMYVFLLGIVLIWHANTSFFKITKYRADAHIFVLLDSLNMLAIMILFVISVGSNLLKRRTVWITLLGVLAEIDAVMWPYRTILHNKTNLTPSNEFGFRVNKFDMKPTTKQRHPLNLALIQLVILHATVLPIIAHIVTTLTVISSPIVALYYAIDLIEQYYAIFLGVIVLNIADVIRRRLVAANQWLAVAPHFMVSHLDDDRVWQDIAKCHTLLGIVVEDVNETLGWPIFLLSMSVLLNSLAQVYRLTLDVPGNFSGNNNFGVVFGIVVGFCSMFYVVSYIVNLVAFI